MASIQDMLTELQHNEVERIEGKILDLTERVYPNLPDVIKQTATVTGVSEEVLVRACVQASKHYKDIDWRLMLDLVRSFYLAKKRIEEREK